MSDGLKIYMFVGGLIVLAVGGVILLVIGRKRHKAASRRVETSPITEEAPHYTDTDQGQTQAVAAVSVDAGLADAEMINNLRAEMHDNARKELERIVGENTDFIKEDVRRNTSELNGYMQQEVSRVVNQELAQYKASAEQVHQATLDSVSKVQGEVAEQYHAFTSQLNEQLTTERQRLGERVYENITDIVQHYIVAAVGNQLNVDQQIGYIVAELEANKAAIIEDIRRGA
jgi:hypothetical protein